MVERTVFFNSDADLGTSPTLQMEKWEKELAAQGYGALSNDPVTGHPMASRVSAVTMDCLPNGDMKYLEFLIVPEAEGIRVEPLRELSLAFASHFEKTINPLMAIHPLTMSAPEFKKIRDAVYESQPETRTDNLGIIETKKWHYEIRYDQESGQIAEITMRDREFGRPFRRTKFTGWRLSAEGRWLPGTVRSTTYKASEDSPLVELHFSQIVEDFNPEALEMEPDFDETQFPAESLQPVP